MTMSATQPAFATAGPGVSFLGALRSEWIKLRSIRSTWWAYVILLAITIGLGAQLSSSLSFRGVDGVPTQDAMQDLAVYAVMVSLDFGALVVSVLGVLVIAGEYGTGMIRSTLTAIPTRLPALIAKAIVFAIVTFIAGGVAFAATVPLSVALLSGNDVSVHLDDPNYWLAILGGVSYLVFIGLIAFSIGAILRNTAGGIAVSLGLVLAAPLALNVMFAFAPSPAAETIATHLPSLAGTLLFSYPTAQSWVNLAPPPIAEGWLTEPWHGILVLSAWVIVLFGVAAVLLKRRDA